MNLTIADFLKDLQKASDYFRSWGDTTDIYYDERGFEFSTLLNDLTSKLQNDSVSDEELLKLWRIFAPTCAWDDFRGDSHLGQRIYDCLEDCYGDRIQEALIKKKSS